MNSSFLQQDWHLLLPAAWCNPALVAVAVFCGIIIGSERQRREKPAGLRTMTLVCLGSAIFTMLSFAFTSTTGDSGRVAAQIVTGIGFLGAGAILHGRNTVSGMTTAAGIWVAAAIGMAVGAGYALAGLVLSLLVNRLLVFFYLYETRWHSDLCPSCVVLDFQPQGGRTRIRIERILVDYNLSNATEEWHELSADLGRLRLSLKLPRLHLYELLGDLTDVSGVVSIVQEICHPAQRPAKK
ncbi:MAG TPA: MgtC/SapB family protein [Candidatus Methylacidiphilales bacterium]|nr:MgtC/SapB family protein [Candidatus Methylacidiphilales bacterium]